MLTDCVVKNIFKFFFKIAFIELYIFLCSLPIKNILIMEKKLSLKQLLILRQSEGSDACMLNFLFPLLCSPGSLV